jgi:hypothetical protein
MPRIRWTDLPPSLRQHLFDRVADRLISAEDLYKLKLWRESEPDAPDGPWYKDLNRPGFPGDPKRWRMGHAGTTEAVFNGSASAGRSDLGWCWSIGMHTRRSRQQSIPSPTRSAAMVLFAITFYSGFVKKPTSHPE